ncbi:MAG: EpsI family protein [Deltaproteobacteria bacterium]|nr:EpsI family protein [Deltaproteobacteria bacterium]
MNSERWTSIGVAAMLLVVGVASWTIHLGAPLVVDATSLASIPFEIQQWRGQEIPMQSDVETMLDADYNVQRSYIHKTGFVVWLYVGYYGTERGGHPEHTPWECYPSSGWDIQFRNVIEAYEGRSANEIIVEKDGSRRLVHFWYQSFRANQAVGGLDRIYERLSSRLFEGRADGSLVRLSTAISRDDDVEFARARLISFAREVVPLLHEHWPEEFVDSAS